MASAPIDSRTHRVLSGVSRVAVLEVIRADGPLDVQAIGARVALHPNTVRAHLDQLIEAGLVESAVSPRTTPGRPRLHFCAVAGTTPGPQDSYQLLAAILAGAIETSVPEPAAAAADLGERWGERATRAGGDQAEPLDDAGVVDRLVGLLADVGFEPTVGAAAPGAAAIGSPGGAAVIELHRCPFVDVALEHPDVVCAVHLGLMRGALKRLHAPPTTVRLEPFVRPNVCLVHVAAGGTPAPNARQDAL